MSKQDSKSSKTPSESSDSTTLTPASTPKSNAIVRFANMTELKSPTAMEDEAKDKEADATDRQETTEEQPATETKTEPAQETKTSTKKPSKCKKHAKGKEKKSKKTKSKSKKALNDDSDSEDSSSSDSSDSDSSDSSSEEESRKKRKGKSSKRKGKDKKKRHKIKKAVEDSDDESDSEEDETIETLANVEGSSTSEAGLTKMVALQKELNKLQSQILPPAKSKQSKKTKSHAEGKGKKGGKAAYSANFKRVDQLWDLATHNYKLRESVGEDDSEFAEFAFLVKRKFDWEGKYRDTVVDIKSKVLRSALSDVMTDCKSVSLEAEEPTIDPKVLFLYLEEFRTHYKKTLKAKIKSEKKKKIVKKHEQQRQLLKSLVNYIDEDFADTKKTLYPLLKAGKITFDLCWALFHPNEIAVTSCYSNWDEPRCFKVDYATHCRTMMRGEWYCIEGRYLEYSGKEFGFGDFEVDIDEFQGPRSITSLATYPLKYHADPDGVKNKIIERGEKFIELEGMHFKFHKGMAFQKKKRQVLKINISGRVMVDPTSFRRINANYPISQVVKRKDEDNVVSLYSDSSDDECGCDSDSEGDRNVGNIDGRDEDRKKSKIKYKYKWFKDEDGNLSFKRIEVDEDGEPLPEESITKITDSADEHTFTEDELLLTSPVVLGFAFSEKLWLEFTITGISPIKYNEEAFDSLVLPDEPKSVVRALVESRQSHGAKMIDDVVHGKGKGMVAVLHGPPGTGKTLTAESISELLKCPLYVVSAGELGYDPGRLEAQLQTVLDMAHSWGAILLLDEADVFLEQRETHDIHRNALVSIFLRLLEYFQGILFLTTNRVRTFDSAFQSRIHVALRYEELTQKAKKAVWEMFIDMARKVEGMEVGKITGRDLDDLARRELNGRQIKNLVRTAQALALNKKQKLTMDHIKQALNVAETFDRDFKGVKSETAGIYS